ncbi:MAG: hypothetical protein KC496_05895 [Anaerolineae bacterium]|nr:hypothetical protein [Anaerolineae bacterium]
MSKNSIRILVVEDDPKWSAFIVDALLQKLDDATHGAARTVFVDADEDFRKNQDAYIDEDYDQSSDGMEATIVAASNMPAAEKWLQALPAVHMVTMDMELSGKSGTTEGLTMLEQVIRHFPNAVSIVVSGRAGEIDIARKSMGHFGAVDALRKGSDTTEMEENLHATLLYAEAVRLVSAGNSIAARAHAQQAAEKIAAMSDSTQLTFKRRLDEVLRELDSSEREDVTGLLNATVTTEYARQLLQSQSLWELGIIVLDGLVEYEDQYGSFNRITAVKVTATELEKATEEEAPGETLRLGYLGEGKFVVIANTIHQKMVDGEEKTSVQRIADNLRKRFQQYSASLGSQIQQNAGNPLSLRFYHKKHSDGLVGLDELLMLEDVDNSTDGPIETSW